MPVSSSPTPQIRTVVFVEGESDRAAIETIAARRGMNLASFGAKIEPLGGITNLKKRLLAFGEGMRVCGLYDAGETHVVVGALRATGLEGTDPADHGFFACARDLEDEFIRALGPAAVQDVIAAAGEARLFRTLQGQPDHRGVDIGAQLRRFLGTKAGRKERYGTLLAEAVPLDAVPAPIDRLLGWTHPEGWPGAHRR
ncbi:TOPRIM nucleotidyl transferase/hydrolase domain-containing protein [Stackebrandtia soli]|uniref:TOPRIM nucleotidyl transferase/hydrolase domain-containing protein n=1 Tax=Stackebrandtia soli TaxID=1892856 RepID=UPI0039ED531C